MKGFFWNIRSIRRDEKQRHIRELISGNNLDFLGLQETMKNEFSQIELARLGGGGSFSWKWSPSKGRSGGILVGIRDSVFDVIEQQNGDYFVILLLADRVIDSRWNLIVVFGAAHVEDKEKFITDLSCVCQASNYPILVGGGF